MISKQKKLKRADIGLIPEDWEEKSVGDFVDIKHGYGFKGEFFTENPNENIVLTPGNFYIGGGFKSDKFKFTTETPLKEYVLNDGDIIVTMTDLSKEGDTLGYSAKVPASDCHKYLHNQRIGLLCLKTNAILPDFLYWVLRTKSYNQFVVGSATGSTVKHTSPDRIKQFTFGVPSLKEQTFIANLLSSLDSKIQLNHQMNCSLEAVGAALFRRWFVDFEFPNQEGKPYRSTGGKMVYSKRLGKKIPDEWSVDSIGNVAKIVRGASPRPIHDFLQSKGMPWVKISDATSSSSKYLMKTSEYIKLEGIPKSRMVKPGTLILSNSATPGLPKILNITACVHDGWLVFDDYKNTTKEFLYHYLQKERESILLLSNGSVFNNLKTDILKNYPIFIPPANLLGKITKLFILLDKKILFNMKQINILEDIRDLLLPKLMSGKIRVPINKEDVEMAVT